MSEEQRRRYAFEALCSLHATSIAIKVLKGNAEFEYQDIELEKAEDLIKTVREALESLL